MTRLSTLGSLLCLAAAACLSLALLPAPASAANYAAFFPGGANGSVSSIALPGLNLSTSAPFSFTFEAWMYPISVGFMDYGSLFYSRNPQPTGVFIRSPGCSSCCAYNFNNYELRSVYGNEDSGSTTCTNISIAFNTWQHVALVANATTQVLYLNLQQAFVYPAFNFTENDFTGVGYLGWDPAVPARTFAGYLDEVRFWNTTRQLSDIAASYQTALTLPQAGLLAYYTFDDQNAAGATDLSGHNLTGVLSGVNYTVSTAFSSLQPVTTSSSGAASASAFSSSSLSAASASAVANQSSSSAPAANSSSSANVSSSSAAAVARSSSAVSAVSSVAAASTAAGGGGGGGGGGVGGSNYAAFFPGGANGSVSSIALPGLNLSTSAPFSFTFEAWMYPISVGFMDYGSLFYSRNPQPTGVFIRSPGCSSCCAYNFNNYELRSVYGNEDSGSTTCTNISIAFNTWQHVALVANATTQVLYLNLQQAFVYPAFNFTENDFTGVGYLGWDPAVPARTFAGYLDEVRFWNTTRQLSDIAASYQTALTLPQAGLLAYYTFDDQNAAGATDLSGHNLTGVLSGVNYTVSTAFSSLQPVTTSSSGAASASAFSSSSLSAASASAVANQSSSSAPAANSSSSANVSSSSAAAVARSSSAVSAVSSVAAASTAAGGGGGGGGGGVGGSNYAAFFPGGANGSVSSIALPGLNLSTSAPFSFTFEAWMYPISVGFMDYGSLFYSRNPQPTGVFIRSPGCSSCCAYNFNNYELRSVYGNEDSGSTTCTNISIAFNTWQHVALVANATTQVLYLNLQQAFVYPAFNFTENDFTGVGYLGWDPAVPARTFAGYLDEVRFWNTTRQLSDIAASYQTALTLPQAGLLAYYTFDDQNAAGATDLSGHNLTGVLSGVNYTVATGLVLQPPTGVSSSSAAPASSAASRSAGSSSSVLLSSAAAVTSPATPTPSSTAAVVVAPSSSAAATSAVVPLSTAAASPTSARVVSSSAAPTSVVAPAATSIAPAATSAATPSTAAPATVAPASTAAAVESSTASASSTAPPVVLNSAPVQASAALTLIATALALLVLC